MREEILCASLAFAVPFVDGLNVNDALQTVTLGVLGVSALFRLIRSIKDLRKK